jgi:hypothetical protein
VAVALVGAFRETLVAAGADRVGELGLDQRLENRLHRGADTITNISGLDCVRGFEQGELRRAGRVLMFHGNAIVIQTYLAAQGVDVEPEVLRC